MNHLNTSQLNTGQPDSGQPGSGHPGSGQQGSGHLDSGHPGSVRPVTLLEMLDAREQRFYRQQRLLSDYHCTIISFTMNIPGPVKNSYLIRRGFELGKSMLQEQLGLAGMEILCREEIQEPTGNEIFYVLDQEPLAVKRITAAIEDDSALGRLFDMDVLNRSGEKTDRQELSLASRPCLICGGEGKACARSRAHKVEELQKRTGEILREAVWTVDAEEAARTACRALLYEVCTTPKPGLVDRANSGSHKDMDIFTFVDSACSLLPYFEACARVGMETAGLKAPETFRQLRRKGRKAELDMFAATKGVNTHKGAIFSMGILCGALGRLPKEQWRRADAVLKECRDMTQGLTAADFAGLTPEQAVTTGQKLYLKYGISGVRGQMEEGLPAVARIGLPVLREGAARGLSINDAGCAALLALITASVDTNLIARSSLMVQQETVEQLKELLKKNPYPDRETLNRLDREFIEANLSPGGSADLLAICYMLYFLEGGI